MVINTNISAQSSARVLAESSTLLSKSLSRLSSGSKLISPEDDAAGMAVSMRFDAQVNRIEAANNNVGNAISMAQTQDGFLKKVSKALDRMSELSILSMDVTKTDGDRALYNSEFQALGTYIKDLAVRDFNGVTLFDGTTFNVTTDSDAKTYSMAAVSLGAGSLYDTAASQSVADVTQANTALTNIKAAITQLAADRSNVGANISVLTSYSGQLGVLKDNLSSANSRIKDVNVADESTQFAKYNILVQAGTAMLSQANNTPQSVLKLIG